MSTRSVIARKTQSGFIGVYHHWDGYPSGLGATLFEVRNGYFKGDTQKMLQFLIDEHPAGWSTIVAADFTVPAAPRPDNNLLFCSECYRPSWAHYSQYYAYSDPWKSAGSPPLPANHPKDQVLVFGHSAKPFEIVRGPECFPKSEAWEVTEENAAGSGCEYAYVFDGNGEMEIHSSYNRKGNKMIGMFGCGDEQSTWQPIAVIDLDSDEPNWEQIGN
jgi:hypothetical protein